MESLGETTEIFDYWQTYSGTSVANNGDIHAHSGLQFCGTDVTIKDTIVGDSDILVSASNVLTTPDGGEVNLYSPNGNISIYVGNANISGIIYAPNGTVQISGSDINLDGMIMAKQIIINAQDVVINQNLELALAGNVQYYNEALVLLAQVEYNADTAAFDMTWTSTFEEGNFDVYSSLYDGNYALLGSVQNATTYSIPVANPTADIYLKVIQTLENGVSKESNTVHMSYGENGYARVSDDSDGDGLDDISEFFYGTDKHNPDTDGDGLSDYAEMFLTGTDPLYADSDEDSMSDGNEDCDGDGLTNLDEIQRGTNPQKSDTDDDDLSDYDEVFVHGTNPLKKDTDDDELNDGDEIALGFNPLVADTDGDGIIDGREIVSQTKQVAVETKDKAITEITVDIETNGNVTKNLTVESMYGIDAMSSEVVGLVGEPFSFSSATDFNTATITFDVDRSKLGDSSFDNLTVMWYNDEEGIFDPVPSSLDSNNSTISATVSHFSQYMIVDSEEWGAAWSKSTAAIKSDWVEIKRIEKNINTIFMVDCSVKMQTLDTIYRSIEAGYNGLTDDDVHEIFSHIIDETSALEAQQRYGINRCQRINIIEDYAESMKSGDKVAVIAFSYDGYNQNTKTLVELTSDCDELFRETQSICNRGTSTYLSPSFEFAFEMINSEADFNTDTYHIVIISDDKLEFEGRISSHDYTNVKVSYINLSNSSITDEMQTFITVTKGDVYTDEIPTNLRDRLVVSSPENRIKTE